MWIVGYVGGREACPVSLKGLHRLEYRGYDSAGVAMVGKDGALNVYSKGKVSDLSISRGQGAGRKHRHRAYALGDARRAERRERPSALLRIGEHRTDTQRHHRELPGAQGRARGERLHVPQQHRFRGAVNLIEYIRTTGGCTLLEAVQQALRQVVGAYAIAVIEKGNRDEIIAARQSSPMAIGIGEGEFFLSSDAASVIEYTQGFRLCERRRDCRHQPP